MDCGHFSPLRRRELRIGHALGEFCRTVPERQRRAAMCNSKAAAAPRLSSGGVRAIDRQALIPNR